MNTSPSESSFGVPDVRWLAGMAMQALVTKQGIPESVSAREEFALWSYRMAQAMLDTEKRLHIDNG